MKKTPFNLIVFSITCVGMVLGTLFDWYLSSVWFILGAGICGLLTFFIKAKKAKGENNS